nr:nuclear egress membrane protein [Mastomys natalensis cytomegalovirus 3]WEG70026.1 nuclear egress membrane protein [Mastomys natalensis cytomegalovirus 3]WEG70166.1 nuclear egress membrane protein [Mastomys natalensis cytomegalovirus 3]WEG70726.1 nuclear egress membrane protein [Mastomys natalensis cytomegalovirus 3]
MDLEKNMGVDLISNTRRILKLDESELRITDSALICKNPNYSLCDAMLNTDVVYPLEYLLSYWECRSGRTASFVFKNTGCRISLSCYIGFPERLRGFKRVCDFNVLSVNESVVVTLVDIERIKPCEKGVLTNCVVRRSNNNMAFNIEVVAFGPESEVEYETLLRDIYVKSLDISDRWTDVKSPCVRDNDHRIMNRRWGPLRKHGLLSCKKYSKSRIIQKFDVGNCCRKITYYERIVSVLKNHATAIHLLIIVFVVCVFAVVCVAYCWYAARTENRS